MCLELLDVGLAAAQPLERVADEEAFDEALDVSGQEGGAAQLRLQPYVMEAVTV